MQIESLIGIHLINWSSTLSEMGDLTVSDVRANSVMESTEESDWSGDCPVRVGMRPTTMDPWAPEWTHPFPEPHF